MSVEEKAMDKWGQPVVPICGNEGLFRCDKCFKPKLYCNIYSGMYFCQVCEAKGNLKWSPIQEVIKVNPFQTEMGQDIILPPSLDDIHSYPVESGSPIHTYLISRGFNDHTIREFDVSESDFYGYLKLHKYTCDGKFKESFSKYVNVSDAAIFPVFDGGYRGYQCRYIYPKWYQDRQLRWIGSPGFSRKDSLFNADTALTKPAVFIAEGIPACLAFGSSGVATFGKGFSSYQAQRLAQSAVQTFYVAYDGGTATESGKLAAYLAELGKKVLHVHFSGEEDPDSVPDLHQRIRVAKPLTYQSAVELQFKDFNPMRLSFRRIKS